MDIEVFERPKTEARTRAPKTGPLRRMDVDDSQAFKQALRLAFHVLEPEDRTQRQLFKENLPELHVLREEGFSWRQLAELAGKFNLKLQPSTFSQYYNEMIADRMEACQHRWTNELLERNALREKTEGKDTAQIGEIVTQHFDNVKNKHTGRVHSVLDIGAPGPAPTGNVVQESRPRETAAPSRVNAEQHTSPLSLAAQETSKKAEGEFGLLTTNEDQKVKSHAFFDLDQPLIPEISPSPVLTKTAPDPVVIEPSAIKPVERAAASPPTIQTHFKCLPLAEGVEPFQRRKGVADFVYKEGELEHPAIPGLMLTLEQRLYGNYLEYVDIDNSGEIRNESLKERPFRLKWEKPIPMTVSETDKDFLNMNMALFPQKR